VEFRRQKNANIEKCKYSQQQTIYLVETFFHSNLLQSSLTSLSIVRSPTNILHKAETRIRALKTLRVTWKIATIGKRVAIHLFLGLTGILQKRERKNRVLGSLNMRENRTNG